MFPPQKPSVFSTMCITAKIFMYALAFTLGLAILGYAMKYSLEMGSYVYSALAAIIPNELILVSLTVTICMVLGCVIAAGIAILIQYTSYWVYKIKYNKKVRWF